MWLERAFAKVTYVKGILFHLATTKTPTTEMRFREVFGRRVVRTGTKELGDGYHFLIKDQIRDKVRAWNAADDEYAVEHQKFRAMKKDALSGDISDFDLRRAYQELRELDQKRDAKWIAADEACMLPAQAGHNDISLDPLSYLHTKRKWAVAKEAVQGGLPISWDEKKEDDE